ncbi:hypothetical protein Bbelb_418840 [Branchiostoma belcheri]|nr:hypothetical protein Bbelb_418840 [Branchiostoma belcheri]
MTFTSSDLSTRSAVRIVPPSTASTELEGVKMDRERQDLRPKARSQHEGQTRGVIDTTSPAVNTPCPPGRPMEALRTVNIAGTAKAPIEILLRTGDPRSPRRLRVPKGVREDVCGTTPAEETPAVEVVDFTVRRRQVSEVSSLCPVEPEVCGWCSRCVLRSVKPWNVKPAHKWSQLDS